jgi:hypothetical protein
MVAVPVLDKTVSHEYEILKLEDTVLTDEYADVIVNNEPTVNNTVLTVIHKNAVKDKHKQCFVTDMVEVALAGMEFLASTRVLSDPNIWYTHGMVPETEAKATGSIAVGNGISKKNGNVRRHCRNYVWQKRKHSRTSEADACDVLARYEIQLVLALKVVSRWLGNEREKRATANGKEQSAGQV